MYRKLLPLFGCFALAISADGEMSNSTAASDGKRLPKMLVEVAQRIIFKAQTRASCGWGEKNKNF